ncbi:YtxH domain-containing protein [Helicobacter himalayensis]|uniref:YtxH domain-containing protein n=1 Tax=Helicobacter himalayensis TaxID=1591088 RepID=UPI003D6E7BC1
MATNNANNTNSANLENLNSVQNNPYIHNNVSNNDTNSANTQSANSTNSTNGIANTLNSFFNSGNTQQDFLKGALIGAVATFILTNEDAQRAIFKGFAKLSSLFEMGIEELKERYEDAKAEVDSNE